MGLRGIPETYVHFEDMEVAGDMAIPAPEGYKRGFASLMNAYNSQRVGAGTVALGLAQGGYELALDFVQEREQFGRPIAEFQGLQWMLTDMSIQLEAARGLIWRAAASGQDGFPDVLLAAQAKIFASEMALKVTTDALQLFGARGYSATAAGAYRPRRAHVHHRRRHRANSAHGGGQSFAQPQTAANPRRLQPPRP